VALEREPEAFLEIIGLDLFAPFPIPWQTPPADVGAALSTRGWVALTPRFARELGLRVGDRFEVTSGSRRVTLELGALVDFRRLIPVASQRLGVMDLAQVQGLFGRVGRLDQIDVQAAGGLDPGQLRARLEQRLGKTATVVTPEERRDEASQLLAAFRLNLTALSLVSVLAGLFLVYTSTQASLVRRRREFGVLRSLGASRRQVVGLTLAEVLLQGLTGVAVGVPAGYLVARLRVAEVSTTLTNLYLLEEIETLRLPGWVVLMGLGVGLGGALAAALLPALDMSRRDTQALLAHFVVRERTATLAPRIALAALALVSLVGCWYALGGHRLRPSGFVVAFSLLCAIPLVTPWLVGRLTSRVRVRSFGPSYSLRSMGARLQGSAFAVACLAIVVSMLVALTIMVGSFRRTLAVWVDGTLKADIYVSTPSRSRAGNEATIDPELVETLAAHPAIRMIDRLRQRQVRSNGHRFRLSGVEMTLPIPHSRFPLLRGDEQAACSRLAREPATLISEPLARRLHLAEGDRLVIDTSAGAVPLEVAGVYYDYGNEAGAAVVSIERFDRLFGPGAPNNVALYLEPGYDPDTVIGELKQRFATAALKFRSNRSLRDRVMAIFDETFAVTRLLQGLSLLIAVAGIALSLLVQARERISELALYCALGASRRQILRVFVGKGLAMALGGLAVGLVGGLLLAAVLIYEVNPAYFGWTIRAALPTLALSRQMALILVSALAASLYPALRASRTPATELNRDDL
jgi:putative ABC transport system permease protein